MQTPDIPLTLKNCEMLGFKIDLNEVHYYIAHDRCSYDPRRKEVGNGGGAVRDLLVPCPDCQPRS